MTHDVDISGMDYAQLSTLRGCIDDRIREMRETEGPALRERFIQQAAAIGLTLEDLVQPAAKRRGRAPKDKDED